MDVEKAGNRRGKRAGEWAAKLLVAKRAGNLNGSVCRAADRALSGRASRLAVYPARGGSWPKLSA